ncbi:MAG: DUF4959 domain-containing protein [Prevotellaceae bacterium]|nr:DUF4959 domain-containing protein [Prevotellaceae bacterium]
MKKIYLFLLLLCTMSLWQCVKVKDWQDPADGVPPGTVSGVSVENLNGGAVIKYRLPGDTDLMGVKAVYSFDENDEKREVYASAFRDSIVLEGYLDTNEHTVELFVVDNSGNVSLPVSVKIQPKTPPIDLIRQTLKVSPSFGGVYTSWENPLGKSIDISLYIIDSIGDRVLYDRYYSTATDDKYIFRNLESKEQYLHIELRDRWDHYAPPLDTILTPLFERQIPGRDELGNDIWSRYGYADNTNLYRGDAVGVTSNQPFRAIHDGIAYIDGNDRNWFVDPTIMQRYIPTGSTTYLYPVYFTIDMGKRASYSRLTYWPRARTPAYSAWVRYEFEVWGIDNPKPISEIGNGSQLDNLKYWTNWAEIEGADAWKNDWVKLADCVIQFPSGTPNNVNSVTSAEDIAFVKNGFSFDIDPDKTSYPCRYLRFVIKKTNNGANYIQVSELAFWGAYADE